MKHHFIAIEGNIGAGKTTLFNVLNGFQKATSGSVRLLGHVTTGLPPNALCRLGMGRTFQVARPFLRMSVLDNVVVGAGAKVLGAITVGTNTRIGAGSVLHATGTREMSRMGGLWRAVPGAEDVYRLTNEGVQIP